jgi:hypothetical protein
MLAKDPGLTTAWEETADGNQIRINNGKKDRIQAGGRFQHQHRGRGSARLPCRRLDKMAS